MLKLGMTRLAAIAAAALFLGLPVADATAGKIGFARSGHGWETWGCGPDGSEPSWTCQQTFNLPGLQNRRYYFFCPFEKRPDRLTYRISTSDGMCTENYSGPGINPNNAERMYYCENDYGRSMQFTVTVHCSR